MTIKKTIIKDLQASRDKMFEIFKKCNLKIVYGEET